MEVGWINLRLEEEHEGGRPRKIYEPEKKRIQLLRMFDHRKHVGAADIGWVTKEIERVKASEY